MNVLNGEEKRRVGEMILQGVSEIAEASTHGDEEGWRIFFGCVRVCKCTGF